MHWHSGRNIDESLTHGGRPNRNIRIAAMHWQCTDHQADNVLDIFCVIKQRTLPGVTTLSWELCLCPKGYGNASTE